MNDFTVRYRVNDTQPQQMASRQAKMLADLEAGWLKVGKAQEAAFAKAMPHVNGFTQAVVNGSAKRVKAAEDEVKKIDIGYYKMVVDGIKYQDKLTAATDKAAKQRQSIFDKAATDEMNRAIKTAQAKITADEKAANQRQAIIDKAVSGEMKAQGKTAEQKQKLYDRAATDEMNRTIKAAKEEQKKQEQIIKAAEKAEKDRQKIFDKAESAEHARMVRAAKEEIKKQDQIIAAAERAAKRQQALSDGPLARQALQNRRVLTDLEVHEAAKNRVMDRHNKDRIDAEMKRMGVLRDVFKQSIYQATGFDSALGKVGLSLLGINYGTQAVMAIAGAFDEARVNASRFTAQTIAVEKALRAVASVEGRLPTGGYAVEHAGQAKAMGMSLDEAKNYKEAFLGRAQIVRGKHLSEKDFNTFMTQAGRLGAAKGIPAELAGDIFGGIAKAEDFKAKGEGSKEALGRAASTLAILDAGSGKIPILAPQLTKVMSALTSEDELAGVFRTPDEAAVAVSTAAEYDPGEAASTTVRAAKSLRDFENKKKRSFFNRAGVTGKDDFFTAIGKMNTVLEEEVAKGVPVDVALQKFGFTGKQEARTLQTFFNARKTVMEPQLERMRGAKGATGTAAAEKMLKELGETDTMRASEAEAAVESAKTGEGAKGKELEIAKRKAEAELIEEGLDTSVSGFFRKAAALSTGGAFRSGGPRDLIIERRAIENLRLEAEGKEHGAREVGVTTPITEHLGGLMSGIGDTFGDKRSEAERLHAIAENTKAMKEMTEELKKRSAPAKAADAPAPPALPGVPVGAGPGR